MVSAIILCHSTSQHLEQCGKKETLEKTSFSTVSSFNTALVSGLLESLRVCPVLHHTNVAQQRHAGCRVAVIRPHLGSAAGLCCPFVPVHIAYRVCTQWINKLGQLSAPIQRSFRKVVTLCCICVVDAASQRIYFIRLHFPPQPINPGSASYVTNSLIACCMLSRLTPLGVQYNRDPRRLALHDLLFFS